MSGCVFSGSTSTSGFIGFESGGTDLTNVNINLLINSFFSNILKNISTNHNDLDGILGVEGHNGIASVNCAYERLGILKKKLIAFNIHMKKMTLLWLR